MIFVVGLISFVIAGCVALKTERIGLAIGVWFGLMYQAFVLFAAVTAMPFLDLFAAEVFFAIIVVGCISVFGTTADSITKSGDAYVKKQYQDLMVNPTQPTQGFAGVKPPVQTANSNVTPPPVQTFFPPAPKPPILGKYINRK